MRLAELVKMMDGTNLDRDAEIENLGLIGYDDDAMLVFALNEKYIQQAAASPNVAGIILPQALRDLAPAHLGVIVAEDPRLAFFRLHNRLQTHTNFYGASRPTVIAKSAQVHPTAVISEQDVFIGERAVIGPHVCLLGKVRIEEDVVLRAGTILGAEGFEFMRFPGGILPVRHAGGVVIHAGAELQAGCCVSRAVFRSSTEIGPGTKIDSSVNVAHNVRIGARCLIAASAYLAGSVRVGDEVWIGPGAVISNGLTVGDRACITLGSVVVRDVAPGERVTGNFALPHRAFLAHWVNSGHQSRHQ